MKTINGITIMLAITAMISVPVAVNSSAQSTNSTMAMDHSMANSTEGGHTEGAIDVRDSSTTLLEGKTLPAGDFIHLYDSTPDHIMSGHVAIKVACDDSHKPAVSILIGQAPNLAPADLEYIPELSTPGKMCIYHVDLMSTDKNIVTDVAIKNDGKDDLTFGPTSSVVIGVNEVMEGPYEEHEGHN